MNIENREEMLKESMSIINLLIPIIRTQQLSEPTFLIIHEILELCVKYGFDQGVIHGMLKGQMESCHKLAELMGAKENE
jgi:hypothetical protein